MREVDEVHWKGAVWKAAYGRLSIKELLTTLKGFGPMEVLAFEIPGVLQGELGLCLAEDGSKCITLFHLEVTGEQREGRGREALQWLKNIFKGEVVVEDPGSIRVESPTEESLPFWIKMYREGLVDVLEGDTCCFHRGMNEGVIARIIEEAMARLSKTREESSAGDESKG